MSRARETEALCQTIVNGERSILDAICPGWDTPFRRYLEALMKSALDYHQRNILELRYCSSDGCSYSIEEVARIFKISKTKAREIENAALETLRRAFNEVTSSTAQ